MIKGCHKSIVFLKDTKSEFFDEAYFVVKPNVESYTTKDIVAEATSLVNEYKGKRKQRNRMKWLLPFFVGAILGFSLMLFFHFII